MCIWEWARKTFLANKKKKRKRDAIKIVFPVDFTVNCGKTRLRKDMQEDFDKILWMYINGKSFQVVTSPVWNDRNKFERDKPQKWPQKFQAFYTVQ